ncbi:4-hydroxy-tetrahydrodipicolinate synthase [Pseudalkalibacillus berkeleyi]|uniref:4-hydroxy-tetrahydrodipicolinate synthase n=1 Tax=Pseudalkalibacillus berkeleyi TaxID=1069813 RepID=A0ABS9GZY8_9BACL|nr:4-hydroxy-tetrahydrodipicolinate synthase [Pseudalkalibacillus berkeleyi]MCF6137163.1 4-hydroxy-tetrahydrodipicolinate synthase [Pseudalkalibacillus berkeleyi]
MNLGNVLTAMVTPFDHKGNIDFNKTTKLIEYLIKNGSDGLVIAGTTGESPTLTKEEKIALCKHVVKVVDKRVPVIAGTGSNNTHASIELTKQAEDAGVDAVMLVAPYYNKPNQQGLYLHFKSIAEATSLPVMLYNIPGRSIVNMSVETIVRLSEVPNIICVKEASGDLDQMTEIITKTNKDFKVYSGDDGLTLPTLSIGGDGIVSVASHVIGNEMQSMVKAYRNGDVQQAAELHRKLLPVMNELFSAPSPTPVKTALQILGIDVGGVRLPLVPLSEQERVSLTSLLNDFAKVN